MCWRHKKNNVIPEAKLLRFLSMHCNALGKPGNMKADELAGITKQLERRCPPCRTIPWINSLLISMEKEGQEKWIFEKAKEIKSRTPGFWCLAMAEYISGLIFSWCSIETKNIVDIQFYMSHSQMLGKFEYGLPAKF